VVVTTPEVWFDARLVVTAPVKSVHFPSDPEQEPAAPAGTHVQPVHEPPYVEEQLLPQLMGRF